MSDYENLIFGNLGQCGIFQLFVFIACNLADVPASWAMTIMSFAAADPDWWSVRHGHSINGSSLNYSHPIRFYKKCPTHPNDTIEFSKEISTIVSEWHLVCESDWIPSTITTVQMVGVLVGAVFAGNLGDLIGRKKSFFLVLFVMTVCSLVASFSSSWQMFAVFRFFIGVSLGAYLIVAYILPIEYIGMRWRTIGGSCPAWAIGVAVLGLTSWGIQDWRKLSILTAGIGAPLLLTWWFIPESCRWLLTKGRIEEAETILNRMAKLNGKPVPDLSQLKAVMLDEQQRERMNHKYSLLDVLKHIELRKQFFVLGFMFFSVVLGYYGFTFGVTKLSGNRHLNLFFSGFVEAIAVLSMVLFSLCLRRKKTNVLLFLMSGIFSLAIAVAYFASEKTLFQKLQNIFSMIAKFFLSAAFTSLYLTTAESFPTVVRNIGFGGVSTLGRIGGLFAPQIIYLHKTHVSIPYFICGATLVASAIMAVMIKDTYEVPLQDEIHNSAGKTRNVKENYVCLNGNTGNKMEKEGSDSVALV